ncbi:hypothetical protein X801_02621 [Opisthorchis viverrini]|uniref:Uncharacterized protein n=2 Tax=Opisthorchis viverrini TaxID=6198 RepID=A0A1S8X4A9_OPIVI|nr:hypothetical protein T265_07352 [Opisthorchis viverrini]KER25128.1 hypothetical protein T265_07352 [Opisthorchis viverrini]OON21481.1 hypothetical protein X801_02621 [Opisthorchis viverrini]
MLGYREASLSWLPIYKGDRAPPHAVEAEKEIHVIRARHQDDVLPGKWPLHIGHIAHLPFHDLEVEVTTFEVLCDTGLYSGKASCHWLPAEGGRIPQNAVQAGVQKDGTPLFVARAKINNEMCVGKALPTQTFALLPWGGQEHRVDCYDILCWT